MLYLQSLKKRQKVKISYGGTLTNWVGHLSDQFEIEKVNHLFAVFVILISWSPLHIGNFSQKSSKSFHKYLEPYPNQPLDIKGGRCAPLQLLEVLYEV